MDMVKKLTFGIGGIATLFSLVANAALPSGYTELEYIQGTGDAGAYICASDIYINPQTDKIETTFEVGSLSSGNGCAIWCARTTWQDQTYSLLWSVNSKYNKLFFQAAYDGSEGSYGGRDADPAVKDTTVTVTAEGNSWYVFTTSGVDIPRTWPSSINASFTQTGGPLFLFAAANGTTLVDGYYSAHKLYSFKIYTRSGDDYALSHDFVPARQDSDGKIGLYDAAAGKFYANSGSGSFVAGDDAGSVDFYVCPIPGKVEVSSLSELDAGIEPTVIVSNLTTSTELVNGTDYTVSYIDNNSVGTARVVITGRGEYASHTVGIPFQITLAGYESAAHYYVVAGSGNESAGESSISGTSSSTGWSTTKGGTKTNAGITISNAIYHVWTDRWMRSPDNADYATPDSSMIVVEPGCLWNIGNKLGSHTLTLNNVYAQGGATIKFNQAAGNYSSGTNTIAGSFYLADGALLRIDSTCTLQNNSPIRLIGRLAATVTGTGAIDMSDLPASGNVVSAQTFTSSITGDLSGFKGDLLAYDAATNGTTSLALELVNAVSIPGDPDPGHVAYVVVTNGARLVVNHDWVSPKSRIWIFGDGKRPTIDVAAGKTLTINSGLIGTVGFVKTGEGTLVLAGASRSFAGDCDVLAGKVRLEGAASSLAPLFRAKKTLEASGYTILDCLSLSGEGVASYIDLGYAPTSCDAGFFMDYMLKVAPSKNSSRRVMGSSLRNNGSWGGLLLTTYCANENTDSGQFGFGVNQYLTKTGGQVADARMRLSLVLGMAHISRGWSQQFDMSAVSPANFNGNIYVGTVNTESLAAGAPMDVYRYKVFEGSTLLHDFVPVTRTSDGVVGLYDTYGNIGFRPAANADYCTSGGAYTNSDDGWLEVVPASGMIIFVR